MLLPRNEVPVKIHELSTPTVVVDVEVLDENLRRMADYCRTHGMHLRPHTKTHKSIEISQQQLALGAIGLTVAKVGEAEVMVNAGPKQILVAHPIIGDEKLRRLAALTKKTQIILAIDSLPVAQGLSRIAVETGCAFGALIEFDSGSHRCGVPAGGACSELGSAIAALPGIAVRGVFTYFGNVWGDEAERLVQMQKAREDVSLTINAFRRAGLSLEIVSGGSTPSAEMSHMIPGITEIRPGTYAYNDLNSMYQGICTVDQCAVRVMTTVVSMAIPNQVIIDAGSKTFSSDRLSSGPATDFGLIEGRGEAYVTKLNEEHGFVTTTFAGALDVGDVLAVIPNHVCTCINMHDEVFTHRRGEVTGTLRIDARGKVR